MEFQSTLLTVIALAGFAIVVIVFTGYNLLPALVYGNIAGRPATIGGSMQ
jgi:hypothetical protein